MCWMAISGYWTSWKFSKTVILLGLAVYELIITNSAYGLVGYIYHLISGASSKNKVLVWCRFLLDLPVVLVWSLHEGDWWRETQHPLPHLSEKGKFQTPRPCSMLGSFPKFCCKHAPGPEGNWAVAQPNVWEVGPLSYRRWRALCVLRGQTHDF